MNLEEDLNFQSICRVCLQESDWLKGLFEKEQTTPLSKRISECASIKVYLGDGLPSSICQDCSLKLIIAYDFRILCRKSDFELRKMLSYKTQNSNNPSYHIILNDFEPPEIKTKSTIKNNTKHNLDLSDPSTEMIIVEGENTTVIRKSICNIEKKDFVKSLSVLSEETTFVDITEVEVPDESFRDDASHFDDSSFHDEDTLSKNAFTSDIDIENMKLSAPLPPSKRRKKKDGYKKRNVNSTDSDNWEPEDDFLKEMQQIPKQKKYELKELDYDLDVPLIPLGPKPKKKPEYKKKQCQVCGKMTTGLKLHMLIHLGIKAFKCEYCGKAFTQRIQYQRHLNIHTGNKPFVCSICGKAFADSTSLRCHNVTHTKERKYKCDICDKAFGYSHTLTAHKRTHTQDRKHICSICGRPFLTRHGLKKHFRIHTGEKPYKCEFCDKRFSTTGNIQTHRRIHTRERPYKCDICQMTFAYRSVLNTHIKIHQK